MIRKSDTQTNARRMSPMLNKLKFLNPPYPGEFIITGDLKMADIIHLNQRLLLVIGRFGVSLGFGDKTIAEVCRVYRLNTSLVLLVLNVFNSHTYSVTHLLSEEYIPELIQYLKNGHQYFLTDKLPYINSLIDKFIEKTENPDSRLLRNFFKEYTDEVVEHMSLEERTVFPYVLGLLSKLQGEQVDERQLSYRIDDFIDNHSNIEEKLDDLKQLLIKHFPPTNDNFYRNQILFDLFDWEYDLNDHNGMEERILAPIVRTLEKEV